MSEFFTKVCPSHVDMFTVMHGTMGLSILILAVFHAYSYYLERKFILFPPFMFLRNNDQDRLMIVLCFGAMVGQISQIIFPNNIPHYVTGYLGSAFSITFYVMEIAIVFLPMFICTTLRYTLMAAVVGFLYCIYQLVVLFLGSCYLDCPPYINQRLVIGFQLTRQLPTILCYVCLIVMFLRNLIRGYFTTTYFSPRVTSKVVKPHQILHIKHMLNVIKKKQSSQSYKQWIQTIIWKPYFRYSTEFLSCMLIVVTLQYYLVILAVQKKFELKAILQKLLENRLQNPLYEKLFNGFFFCYELSLPVAAITYVGLAIHLFHAHRQKILSIYQGKVPPFMNSISYTTVVEYNLSFAGYLVAYMTWGIVTFFVALVLIIYFFYAGITVAVAYHKFGQLLLSLLKYLGSILLIPVLIYVIQILSVYYIFKQDVATRKSTSIRNMKLYHIGIYFFFFFNIIIGFISCLLRSIYAFMISLLLLGRIDESSMATDVMKQIDYGHLAYYSFLLMQTSHKNPVMRCFCQILLDKVQRIDSSGYYHLIEDDADSTDTHQIKNAVAFNRWFLALTLARNATLIPYRKTRANFNIKEEASFEGLAVSI